MAFLTQPDYFTFIKEVHLQQVIENNQNYVVICEAIAEEEITMAINERYDFTAVFAAQGADRNPIIISYMVCITLYHLLLRVGQDIPKKYDKWYTDTKTTLTEIAGGILNPNLPRIIVTDSVTGDEVNQTTFLIESNEKMEDKW